MTKTEHHADVVVGVDFSPEGSAAVDLAAYEAERRHVPLVLLNAIDPSNTPTTVLSYTLPDLIADAERDLEAMAKDVARRHPQTEIRTTVAHAAPTEALVHASAEGSLVVLCSRGTGGFSQLLLGSVAWRVSSRATGPVLLVRPGAELPAELRAGPVLVGVDGSKRSSAATDFAVREAALRGTTLVAVNVWGSPWVDERTLERASSERTAWLEDLRVTAEQSLSESLAGIGSELPEVPVDRVALPGLNVPEALLGVARDRGAALIVVGAGGHHSFPELALGAIGVQLSHHADRPVAVVHHR